MNRRARFLRSKLLEEPEHDYWIAFVEWRSKEDPRMTTEARQFDLSKPAGGCRSSDNIPSSRLFFILHGISIEASLNGQPARSNARSGSDLGRES